MRQFKSHSDREWGDIDNTKSYRDLRWNYLIKYIMPDILRDAPYMILY